MGGIPVILHCNTAKTLFLISQQVSRFYLFNFYFTVQPYEFCSDVFLLPLGSPPKDTLDLTDSEDEGAERLPPNPPPLDPAIYEILMQSLDNNNRPPPIRTKHKLNTIQEARDNVEHFI